MQRSGASATALAHTASVPEEDRQTGRQTGRLAHTQTEAKDRQTPKAGRIIERREQASRPGTRWRMHLCLRRAPRQARPASVRGVRPCGARHTRCVRRLPQVGEGACRPPGCWKRRIAAGSAARARPGGSTAASDHCTQSPEVVITAAHCPPPPQPPLGVEGKPTSDTHRPNRPAWRAAATRQDSTRHFRFDTLAARCAVHPRRCSPCATGSAWVLVNGVRAGGQQ